MSDTPKNNPKMVTPSQRQLASRPEDEAAAEAPANAAGQEANAAGGGRSEKSFSETQWFMKGIEVDADLLEMVEEEDYDRDESISEEDRKGFTLRRDDES